jgi:cytochrome b
MQSCRSIRHLIVLALVAGVPGIASAQFTTFIPPKATVVDSVKAVVVAQKQARTDSVVNMQLTNMKTWVDSAAGVAPAPMTAADSLETMNAMNTSVAATTTATETTMRNGSRAPATASALPFIALLGVGVLGLGMFLLAGPRAARTRA